MSWSFVSQILIFRVTITVTECSGVKALVLFLFCFHLCCYVLSVVVSGLQWITRPRKDLQTPTIPALSVVFLHWFTSSVIWIYLNGFSDAATCGASASPSPSGAGARLLSPAQLLLGCKWGGGAAQMKEWELLAAADSFNLCSFLYQHVMGLMSDWQLCGDKTVLVSWRPEKLVATCCL